MHTNNDPMVNLLYSVGFFIGGPANLISAAISADLGRQVRIECKSLLSQVEAMLLYRDNLILMYRGNLILLYRDNFILLYKKVFHCCTGTILFYYTGAIWYYCTGQFCTAIQGQLDTNVQDNLVLLYRTILYYCTGTICTAEQTHTHTNHKIRCLDLKNFARTKWQCWCSDDDLLFLGRCKCKQWSPSNCNWDCRWDR